MNSQAVLIGLDGATYTILDQLIEQGVMPNLAAFFEGGTRAILSSTIHPLTPPAWTTMTTGQQPGNHGIFDFIRVDRSAATPSYTLATSGDLRAESLWSMVHRAGCQVTSLNFPMMFPPPKLEGSIVPGYVPWSYLGRAIHPRSLFQELKQANIFNAKEMSTDWEHERKAVQGLAEDELDGWVDFHIARERRWFAILKYLMENRPAALTAVLFDGVDRIQHLCYHLIDSESSKEWSSSDTERTRAKCLQYFAEVDGYIGWIVDRVGDDCHVMITSDHGFCAAGDYIFYANTWLEQEGHLAWVDGVPLDDQGRVALDESTEASTLIDWSVSKAYALSSSGNAIYIRQARADGEPGVPPESYESFRRSLREGLLSLTHPVTGLPFVKSVWTREEAFPGRFTELAPDLTLQLQDYSFLSVLRADAPIKPRRVPYATHHPDGVIIARGPGVPAGSEADPINIADVTPTALYCMGIPVPEGLDGHVATGLFDQSWRDAHPIATAAAPDQVEGNDDGALSAEADAQIRDRLKALGYL